jgi:hypothetical protein
MSTDGIQTGTGLNVFYNKFTNIFPGNTDNHTDSIQLNGAPGTVIRGNYLYDNEDGIVAYNDGLITSTIEDNVIDLPHGRDPWGIEAYNVDHSFIRHNTIASTPSCGYGPPCGGMIVSYGKTLPPSHDLVIENNIVTFVSIDSGSVNITDRNNMVQSGATGADFIGIPIFVGGSTPTTYAGYLLASGSPGKARATDALDVGVRGN